MLRTTGDCPVIELLLSTTLILPRLVFGAYNSRACVLKLIDRSCVCM
jgi:hypothetical protein